MSSNPAYTEQLQSSSTNHLQTGIDEKDTPTKRHSSYYFDYDPMAIFSVGDELFRIHRYYLTQGSEVFRGMFTSPSEEGKDADGINDDQPIILPDVTIREFEVLMDYLYLQPHVRSRYSDVRQNLDFYVDLLSISHRFLFDDIFQYARQRLESVMDQVPVETRLLIGDTYGLKDWLSSAFETLIDRQESITAGECKAMGYKRVVAFLRAREFRYRERLQIAEENLKRIQDGSTTVSQPAARTPTSNQAVLKMFLL